MTEVIQLRAEPSAAADSDNGTALCRGADNGAKATAPMLPKWARLPINRCNLPAVVLGGITFQRHPTDLLLDGVAELHADLFRRLDGIAEAPPRAQTFRDYMTVHFRLEHLDEAGLTDAAEKRNGTAARGASRAKANWMRALRGWSFDADGREGAVLKGWVESRFGLLPRFHGEPLRDFSGPAYHRYQEMRAAGLYGTNALEGQLDLLYAYCQYELQRTLPTCAGFELHRGINRIAEHEVLAGNGARQVVLFNNLTSFSRSRERAGEFGDFILSARVPAAKVFFFCGLLPGVLKGEDEYLVIGGAYEVEIKTL